mgnify:CR=1 FL=1
MAYSRTNTYGKTARGGVSGSQLADLHEQQTLLAIAAERAKREQEAQLAEEQKKLAAAQRDAQKAAYNKRKAALANNGMSRFAYNEGYNAYYGDYENILKSDEFKKFLENYSMGGKFAENDESQNQIAQKRKSDTTLNNLYDPNTYYTDLEGFYRRDEVQLLDYLKSTDKAAYEKYNFELKRKAQERQSGYKTGDAVSFAEESPVLSSIQTVLVAPVTGISAGVAAIQDTVDVAKGRGLNPYSTAHQMSGRTSLIRETVSSDMSGVGAFIYNTAMSVGDNIVNFAFAGGLLGGAPAAGTAAANIANAITTVLMSSPAAADAILDASEAGMTDGQAVLYGWLIGASAAASEYINPTEKIVRGAGPKKLITNVFRSALMEGVEEINNNIADEAINRIFSSTTGVVMSESEKLYDDMIAQGYSEKEAVKSSLWLFAKDAGTAFLGGAVAGGVMSGGATAVKTPFIYSSMGSDVSADTKARADMIQNIRDNPDVYSKDTLRAAKKASARLDSGKEGIRTDMAVGKARFRAEIDLSTSKAMNDSVTAELKQRLVKTGMKAETAAKVAQKMVDAWEVDNKQKNNEKLTRSEKSAQKEIEKNYPAAKNLLSDLSARQSVIKAASESKSVQSLRNATQNMAENLGAAGQSNIRKSGDANYREYLEKVGGVDLSDYESGTENYKNLVVTDIDRKTGKVTVRNKAGEVMNATAAGVDADTAALLYYAASFDSKEDANAFLSGYDFVKDKKGMNPARYDNEMKIVMGLGKLGWDAEKIRKNTSATLTMPDELINMFAKKAREASDSAAQAKQKAVDSAAEKAEKSGQKAVSGKVILESGVEEKNLTENQKEQVAALRVLSDIFGYKIRVFSSVKEDGTLDNRQGYYNLAKREFGIDIYAGADSVADVCSVAMLRTMSHEMIHMAKQMSPGYFERYSDFIFDNFLSENADELIFRRQRQYEKANNGKKLSYNEAMEEVVADASEMFLKGFLGLKVELGNQAGEGRVDMETVTEDLQKPKYKGVLRILGNVIERMKRKISAFKRAWNGAQAKTEEGKTVSAGDAKAYEQAQQMFNELILRASANYKLLKDGKWESDSEKSERSSMRDSAEGGAEITEKDIAVLRDIPRKSINNFTSEEIQKTEVWAKRFYQELGTKSPYFRAWFGDWRAKDTNTVDIVSVPTIEIKDAVLEYGTYFVPDTSWEVYAGRTLKGDTIHHSGGERINVKSLNAIDAILKNAVLLDTITSENNTDKKAKYTAFLHKLYTPIRYNEQNYLAVTTIEEYFDESKNSASRRAYNLKAIKIEPADGRLEIKNSTSPMSNAGSTISISDLYALVKTYDKKFSPKPVNPALLNEDGTPRTLYHQTARDFTVFDNSNPVAGASDSETPNGFFFKENDHNIGLVGNKQMAVYLRMTNPLHFKNRQEANRWYCQNITGYERLQNEMTSALQPIEQKMDVIENEMFKDDISDTEYEKLDKQWNELVKQMGEKEDSYRRKLRGLLNDYFIRSDSGYDGIILDYDGHRYVDGKRENVKSYIVFNRSQIKSATDNIGTFDSDNPDIRYSERGNGYDGYSMSNNARDAYERGEMPLSRWTKQKVINQIAQDNGVSPEDVSLEFPYEHYLEKAGWHHTSSKYNKTYFYYVTDDTSGVIFSERAKEKIQSDKIEQAKKYLEENKENLKKAEAWKPEITEDDQYYYIRELDNHDVIYNKNYTTKEKVILELEEKAQEKISYLKQRIENEEKRIRDLGDFENFRYSTRNNAEDVKENISDVLTDSSRTFADSLTEPTKYQTRDGSTTDYVTSRLALADAFEQIATNQRERNWAERYRERAEELAGYNTRLRELWKDYFTKGHSAAERAEIRTQIRSLTQKIQTADGGLTQFVNAKPLAAYVTRVQNEVARQERENSRAKLAEFRKSENALVRSILEEHRQKLAQRRAAGERKNVIDKMGRLSGKFLSMLEHPAEGSAKHFNAGIVRSALEVLDTLGNGDIDLQRKMEERAAKIAKIEAEMEKLATGENSEEPRVLDRIEELRGQKQRLETYLIGNTQNANALKEKLAELRERYESDDFKNTGEYDETISQMLKYLREEIAGKPVSELTTEQLQKAYDIMKAIYKTSTDANKLIGSKFRESVEELSHDFIGDMEKSGHKNRKYIDPYFVMQLRPRTFFSYLSGGKGEGSAAVKLYNMLNDGQTKMLTIKRDAYLLFSDLINGKQNRENIDNMAEMVDIGLKDRNGNKVEISRGMMITLYMHLQNEQNAAHFMMGGLTVPNMKAYYKGDYDGAFRSGADRRVYGLANAVFQLQEQLETTRADLEVARALKNNKLAAELEGRISGLESSLATAKVEMMVKAKELSDQIEKKFTAYERRYVEAAKAFFWEFSGDTLNKTAMERYGFNRFTVKNYFPIQTDTRYLMSAKADMATFSKNFSLEAMGMTKDRVGATNPLLLLDISAIVDRHINDISLYAGFVQAVHNFNKVYNFTDKNYQKSVKAEINDYFGASATKYIDKLLLDIAGARRQEPNVLDKFRSNYAGAVLAVNAGVTLKQAASLPTAAAVLGWKNMGTATARFAKDWASKKNWRETFETIQKYTPLLWYRQRGYMDADIGDIYRGKSISDTVTGKVPWLMNWITAMDAHTVGSLWYACEENVKDSNKALQVGSEEYYKEVAKLFNQVTYDTQPNYTVMQRPDILRNPNALVRALFMFKTQIMQNFNILAEACMEYGYARKNFEKGSAEMRAAKVKLSRAITSQLVAALIIALIDGTRKLLRRNLMGLGKEIEITHIPLEYANAFMSSLFGTFTGGTEIYEMVYSIVSGDRYYGFGDVDAIGVPADIATEIVNISKSAINGNFEWQDLEGFAGKLARAFGLPLENILKILKGLYNISMKIIER